MEHTPLLYRKRLIPEECLQLKDDILLYRDEEMIVTKWKTLHPKKHLDHGFSCYFLKKGLKVSKFLDANDTLLFWYCDIISHTWDEVTDTYIFTDLLTDVIVHPDGFVKVVDLDEMADAVEQGLMTPELLLKALRRTDALLRKIYTGHFNELQQYVEKYADSL